MTPPTSGEAEHVNRDTSGLTREQKLEIVAAESQEMLGLLEDFKTSIADVREKLQPLCWKSNIPCVFF